MEKPKIAILFWGITRSLKYTLNSLEKNLFNILIKNNYQVVKFMHTFVMDDNKYTNKRANEIKVELDFEEYKLLKPDYVKIDNQDKIAKKIGLEKYRTMGNPWSAKDFQTLDNFILACYSKYKVYKMLKKSNLKFDYVIYMRPDVMCLNPFPIKSLSLLNNTCSSKNLINKKSNKYCYSCLMPNFHHFGPYKINDRMFVSTLKNCKYFGNMFKNLYRDSKKMVLHSETYLGFILNRHKFKIHYINFYFNRVRANGLIKIDYKIH
jgi:hypothetical protein